MHVLPFVLHYLRFSYQNCDKIVNSAIVAKIKCISYYFAFQRANLPFKGKHHFIGLVHCASPKKRFLYDFFYGKYSVNQYNFNQRSILYLSTYARKSGIKKTHLKFKVTIALTFSQKSAVIVKNTFFNFESFSNLL